VGDLNNDGRLDVLIGINGGSPLLLRNNAAPGNNWLGLRLKCTTGNPDAVAARVTWSAGGVTRSRFKAGSGSYLSSHDPRMVLGLGKAANCDWVEIRWPEPRGKVDRFSGQAINKYHTVTERA